MKDKAIKKPTKESRDRAKYILGEVVLNDTELARRLVANITDSRHIKIIRKTFPELLEEDAS